MRKFLKVLLLLPFFTGCSSSLPPSSTEVSSVEEEESAAFDFFPSVYDAEICKASKDFLPVPTLLFGCTLYKAQLYQESLFDPNARSSAGAEGIAQFMPPTWEETMRQMGIGGAEPTNASVAIRAGAFYMARLRNGWTAERKERELMEVAQASYNAGFGNILKAQRVCGGAPNWSEILLCLPQVTGRHAKETITYVERIWGYWAKWQLT